jgi:tRNA wybutosine-synthesizing protein 2
MRTPTIEVIAGDSSTETLHMENGCFYKLDVARVMFSKGNVYERQRIAQLVQDGEVVVDLFAGIGQFSIQIGKHARPKRVYAVEKNLVAYRYLCDNIRINKLGHVVIPLHGDCRDVAPRGTADRVIMGILHVGHLYLPLALDVLKDKGGVIHYHETAPRKLGFSRALERIAKAAGEREVEILEKRVVKRYAPGVDHLVVDALIGPRKTLR